MIKKIKVQKLGKLRIYLKSGETVKSEGLLRKIFPRTAVRKILDEAKSEGFLNAHVFQTHSAYRKGEKSIHTHAVEGDNSGLTICIELVDEKDRLQQFVIRNEELLAGKTIIFKEVEYWSY
ncbi:MAG: DUF190 domain-containing protein [Bacteroidetes bacterium]|nr:DUF190 domain-containing protein [Bacteroidota bacterium]